MLSSIISQIPSSVFTWTACMDSCEFPQLGASRQVLQMLTYSGTGCCQVNIAGYIATIFRRFFVWESSSSICSTSEMLPTTSWDINIMWRMFWRHSLCLKINSASIQIDLLVKEESSFWDLRQVSEASVNHTPKKSGNPLSWGAIILCRVKFCLPSEIC